jgi:curved DNA-binding protein CbpA
MSELKNYYEVLEISSSAKSEDIYQSYLRAKMAYSADSLALYSLMSTEECRNVLDLVEEAYSILSDPLKRKRYDEARGLNREFNLNSYNNLSDRVEPIRTERVQRPTPAMDSSHMFNADFKIDVHRESSTAASQSLVSNQNSNIQTNVSKLVTQKRFALDFVSNTDFERSIEEAEEFSGELLRKIREYKNVDLDRLADMTKVSKSHILNIELEDFSKLPASVYVRGFVFQYAKCLKLKPDVVANSYVTRMKKIKP